MQWLSLTNPDGTACTVEAGHIALLTDTPHRPGTQLLLAGGVWIEVQEARAAILAQLRTTVRAC